MIGRSGERGSGIFVLSARHDDDDDIIYIYIYISLKKKPKTGYFRIINLFPSCFSFLV